MTPAERAVLIDRRFSAEAEDPEWNQRAARRLSEGLSSGLPEGTTIGSIACRASLCRVESFHTSRANFREYVEATFRAEGKLWDAAASSMVAEESPSGVRALSFIAREGSEIPSVEGDE